MNADQVRGLDEVRAIAGIVTQQKNEFERHEGYSPSQWVLGSAGIRMPRSLLVDSERERLEMLDIVDDPESAFAQNMRRRELARIAYTQMDSDSSTACSPLPHTTSARTVPGRRVGVHIPHASCSTRP